MLNVLMPVSFEMMIITLLFHLFVDKVDKSILQTSRTIFQSGELITIVNYELLSCPID